MSGSLRRGLLAGLVLCATTLFAQDPSTTGAVHLVVLHINDTHGQWMAAAGGVARVATLVRQVRAESPGHVLLLHAGDEFSRGDGLTVWSGGDANFRVLNLLQPDAFTPGNGDFYFGLANLRRVAGVARFPLLHANATPRDGGAPVAQPYVFRTVAGVRIALLGVGRVAQDHPSATAFDYRDPLETARDLAPTLTNRADVVIALTHIGFDADRRLAAAAPAIDVIVGGDSHTPLPMPIRVPRVVAGVTNDAWVVQAGSMGVFLGRLDLDLVRAGGRYRVARASGSLLPILPTTPADPDVATALARERGVLTNVAFVAPTALANPRAGLSPAGQFVVDTLRAATGADVVLLDRGAVASDIPAGTNTIADLCRLHPWRNAVLRGTCTGAELRPVLDTPALLVAGAVTSRETNGTVRVTVAGQPLLPERVYTVAVGTYACHTLPSLRALALHDTGERVDTLLARTLAGLKPDALRDLQAAPRARADRDGVVIDNQ